MPKMQLIVGHRRWFTTSACATQDLTVLRCRCISQMYGTGHVHAWPGGSTLQCGAPSKKLSTSPASTAPAPSWHQAKHTFQPCVRQGPIHNLHSKDPPYVLTRYQSSVSPRPLTPPHYCTASHKVLSVARLTYATSLSILHSNTTAAHGRQLATHLCAPAPNYYHCVLTV